ncbi:MAG: glycoside hydrolase [Planctomycetes bacterium]|nr:glycoside hydrolase [Planctomycetota bacterium]
MSNKVVLELPPRAGNARNSEGAFVTLDDGRLLFAYTKYGADAQDAGHAHIAARYSSDAGRTWSASDKVLVKQEGSLNVMSVSLLRLHDGRIAMLTLRKDWAPWVKKRGAQAEELHNEALCMPWVRFSEDGGKTFGKPACITVVPGYYVVNNDRMIQLSTGRLIVPAALHRSRMKSRLRKPGEKQHGSFAQAALITFFFSDDGGATWFESLTDYYECFPNGQGLQEPGVIEMKDGRIWSWCRAGAFGIDGSNGRQWQSFSGDGGVTWSEVQPSQFVSPCSPMSVKRIPSTGHLLAVWNDHSGRFKTHKAKPISWGRTPLVSAISRDEGKTWKHHKLLESSPEHGFCYAAIYFADDALLLAYCSGGKTTKMVLDRLRMRRIDVKDLYM